MNINETKEALGYILDTNPAQAVMLWGKPGIGKSEAVRQMAADRDMKVVETRLSQMDPVDIKGVPTVKDGKTQWMTPSEFPTEADGPTIWFLDEINAGARATMASAMQLVLDRRSGDYKVPDNVVIWAAGNETSHGAVANAMPSALANRFLHLEVEPDLGAFLDWGLKSGLSHTILSFLRFRPELLHDMGKSREMKGFPSPRTWEFVSKLDLSEKASEELKQRLISAAVGAGAATEYLSFLQVFKSLPSLSDILMNPTTAPVPEEPSAQYAVVSALVQKVVEDTLEAIITYLSRLPREFMVMGMQDVAKSRVDLVHSAAFTRWEIENHNLLGV